MTDIETFLKRQKEVRDLETIPMTRGQLRQLLIRINVAEGMSYSQAEIHASMHVDRAFIELRRS